MNAAAHQRKPSRRRDLAKEMEVLYRKLGEALYDRMQPRRALQLAERLDALLDEPSINLSAIDGSILGNEMRAEIAEARQEWAAEVRHRRKKIRLLEKLRATARPTDDIDPDSLVPLSELAHNHVALALALRDAGRPRDARAALDDAERLFRRARAKFRYGWLKTEIERACSNQPARRVARRRNPRRPGTFVPLHGRQ